MTKVFVSYRRSDADADAGRIADRLVEAFGDDNVFHDHEALKIGLPWQQQIDAALLGTDVTLVVIGPHWLDAALPDGTPRLHDPKDMVAYEIAKSIERGIRVVPLFVGGAGVPDAAALPEGLQALPKFQGRAVRTDSFGADMNRLIDNLSGRPAWKRVSPAWLGAGAAGLVLAAWLGAAVLRKPPVASAGVQADTPGQPVAAGATPLAPAEARSGILGLRIRLDQASPVAKAADDTFQISVNEPVRIVKAELPAPKVSEPGVLEIVAEDTLLPGRGERYEADVRRKPMSAALDASLQHGRTTVCLVRAAKAPATELRAVVDCVEGERCTTARDNPGHFEACGKRVGMASPASWSWIGTANAQPAAEAAWVVPSIETLTRQRQAGNGPAYTEVRLTSAPLPALAQAKEVSVEVAVNGRTALIDGLPADASAVPFVASQGLRLSFGLENLDFAGAKSGYDEVGLKLRFLDGKNLVRESRATLKYIALRNQPESEPIGDGELGIRWSAVHHAGRSEDRFQVFITSSEDIEALERAKKAFDDARFTARTGAGTYALIGVVRPPLGANRAWGLNVGLVLKSGQVRFTFDDELSGEVCRRIAEMAAQGERRIRKDSYRRSVDDTRQYKTCDQFLRR